MFRLSQRFRFTKPSLPLQPLHPLHLTPMLLSLRNPLLWNSIICVLTTVRETGFAILATPITY